MGGWGWKRRGLDHLAPDVGQPAGPLQGAFGVHVQGRGAESEGDPDWLLCLGCGRSSGWGSGHQKGSNPHTLKSYLALQSSPEWLSVFGVRLYSCLCSSCQGHLPQNPASGSAPASLTFTVCTNPLGSCAARAQVWAGPHPVLGLQQSHRPGRRCSGGRDKGLPRPLPGVREE